MGVVSAIKTRLDPVERLQAELDRLNAAGAALVSEIARLADQEDDLEDETALARAMVATRAAKNRLRKIDGQVPDVRARLDVARSEVRAKLLAKLQSEHAAAGRAFLDAARPALDAGARLIAAREAVQAAGFRREYDCLPVPALIGDGIVLAPDLLEIYAAALNPKGAAPTPRPAPLIRRPEPDRSAYARQVTTLLQPLAAPPPARTPLREVAADGEQLVQIVRNGVEHLRTGAQLIVGDVVAVPAQVATALANNGGGFPTTAEEVAAADAAAPAREVPGAASATGPWERIDSLADLAPAHRAATGRI